MASAREVRAAVRAQLADQLNERQDAALSVAAAWSKVEKARERLAAAEEHAGTVVATAVTTVALADLSALAGIPAADLRRLNRKTKPTGQGTPPVTTEVAEPLAAG